MIRVRELGLQEFIWGDIMISWEGVQCTKMIG